MMALLAKNQPKTEMALDKKSMDIIFNAKVVKTKKVEAQKIVKEAKAAKAKAGGTSEQAPVVKNVVAAAPEESQAPTKPEHKSSRALTSLRNAVVDPDGYELEVKLFV